MSIVLIVLGLMVARFGARIFVTGEARGGQDLGAGLITLLIQITGIGLVVWGVVRLFS